jgi:hypothetical protein
MYHFIYPSKDAYIYELNTNSEENFGSDDSLVLKKDFDGTSLNGVSRVLLQFDLTELSQSIATGEITTSLDGNGVPPKYYLRLYEQKTSELSPTYQINAYALSQSWEEGTGYTVENPNSRDGVSWLRGNESFDNQKWYVPGIDSVEIGMDSASKAIDSLHLHLDTGSRSEGGGIWYDEGGVNIPGGGIAGVSSQSFSYESVDIEMEVGDIINKWLDGTRQNNGLILKWSGSQEDSSSYTGDINFFSSNAQSIYSPKIEVRWDEHTNDYLGTFEDFDDEFMDASGSFGYPDVPIDPVTIDGTDDNYLFMIGLRKTYKETEKPRFRVAGRERYITKTVSTTKSTLTNKLIPHGSGSYSILDVETGATLIPFGDYSKLSTDKYSNYFKLKLDGFINNRLYRILLRLRLNDGRYRIFDDNFDFKVIS